MNTTPEEEFQSLLGKIIEVDGTYLVVVNCFNPS